MKTEKHIFSLFIVILTIIFFNCNSYKGINISTEYYESGKCYISEITSDTLNVEYQFAFILEYHPPVFKTKKKVLSREDLLKYQIRDSLYRIEIVNSFIKYLPKDHRSHESQKGFVFCLVEVPKRFEEISLQRLEQLDFIIEQKQVIKKSYISKRYIKKRPKKFKMNQYYYEAGYYSNLTEYYKGEPYYIKEATKKIQKALNKLGYKVEVNSIMNDETKAALLDLQKKNGLPEGNLNMETLRFLGLQF